MNDIQKNLLAAVADLHEVPEGAYNFRVNGAGGGRRTTEDIDIITKTDNPGIDIIVKPHTKSKSVHIPVVITETGLNDLVYNDFYIGEGADVTIVAGCGIHNSGNKESRHDGVHTFHIGKGAKVVYVEKHYGEGDGGGENVLNPTTIIEMEEDSYAVMELVQIKGVDSTIRKTKADLKGGAKLIIKERLMTHGNQFASTSFECVLNGDNAHAHIASRSVARDKSKQEFDANLLGNANCYGRSECDAIIMDDAYVRSTPSVTAAHPLASLTHEATIGKIAGEQLTKLMTLGLTEQEAEEKIIAGFIK